MTNTHLSIYKEEANCELRSPVRAYLDKLRGRGFWKVVLAFLFGLCAGKAFGQSPLDEIKQHAAEIQRLVGELEAQQLPPLPRKAEWEAAMKTYGLKLRDFYANETNPELKLYHSKYDSQWVFWQIADYTGDKKTWSAAAQLAEKAFRDYYVLNVRPDGVSKPGGVVAKFNTTHGLVEDFLRTGDSKSKAAVLACAKNGAYTQDWVPASETIGVEYGREKAFVLQSYLNAERLGAPLPARAKLMVDQILDDIDSCFVRKDAAWIKPFYLGLTASAIIQYDATHPDPRIKPALKVLADGMWPICWNEEKQGMLYTDRPSDEPEDEMKPAPDLNMLVLPIYWEVYKQTKDDSYRVKADKLFAGCVALAEGFTSGKHFNQCYRTSIAFVKERAK